MHANVATSLPWLSQMITDVTIDKRQGVMMLTHPDGITFYDLQRDTLCFLRRNNDVSREWRLITTVSTGSVPPRWYSRHAGSAQDWWH